VTSRKALLKLQRYRCYLCGKAFACCPAGTPNRRRLNRDGRITSDHVRPRAGGHTLEGNKLLAHGLCNVRKADRAPWPCELIYLAAIKLKLAP
jgi:hypothetical protein